ncbi:hypothetical protein ACFFQF_12425 [Haladaptatus pallidirubidus]|nr:hypothetical protein [Haladaptatus pallidirubidus]
MQTKTARNVILLPDNRAVQAFAIAALFAATMPFADAVASGTLSRLGFTVADTGSHQALSLLFVVGTSANVAFCRSDCWRVVRS